MRGARERERVRGEVHDSCQKTGDWRGHNTDNTRIQDIVNREKKWGIAAQERNVQLCDL